ncbi:urease accessory protein UreD [Actinomadura rubrobrunea]|uniref:urease accessory protein UreD n=1 Tax=Actinomadura rubrobrunea TaxID=115335 RepID=UPI000D04B3A3|nr:urease accessory protein UreD [Actinomadura rubrobrunea]
MTRRCAARAAVAAERDAHGRTRCTRLRSDGPLALRETAEGVHLVGAAAGPLGGDVLELDVAVGPGARLAVRSAAAALVLPGDGTSRLTVRARVGPGARLDFAPEPTVAAAGCDHRSAAEIALAEDATLRWREEIVLGRHGERPGRLRGRLDVAIGRTPLLRHELRVGDGHGARAVLGDAGAAGSVLLVRPGLAREAHVEDGLAVLPLAHPSGVLITAVAPDAALLRRRLARGERVAARARGETAPRGLPADQETASAAAFRGAETPDSCS